MVVYHVVNMDKAQAKLIQNLKEQITLKRTEQSVKQYVHVIQQVVKDILNEPEIPLTFIKGSTTIYDIDNIKRIVDYYTMYPTNN